MTPLTPDGYGDPRVGAYQNLKGLFRNKGAPTVTHPTLPLPSLRMTSMGLLSKVNKGVGLSGDIIDKIRTFFLQRLTAKILQMSVSCILFVIFRFVFLFGIVKK